MEFLKANLDEVNLKELLLIMEKNKNIMKEKLEEISKMTAFSEKECKIVLKKPTSIPRKETQQAKRDDSFEEEIYSYLKKLDKLSKENINEMIGKILPERDNYNYERIIYRLQLEIIKTIRDIEIFIRDEELTSEEVNLFLEEKKLEEQKLLYLKNALLPIEEKDLPVENTLIFIPTIGGSIRIINELEKMPLEYYPAFLELILSIKNGTFKNAKRFLNNDNITGILEVKGYQVRVLYERLAKNTYAVISAFIKKTTNDNGYRSSLDQKVSDYFAIKGTIKSLLENPEFLEENKMYEQEVFNILTSTKEKTKEKVNKND